MIALLALGLGVPTSLSAQGTDTLPHAFPREGATRLFANPWITAWDVTWADGVATPLHRHRYDYFGIELETAKGRVTSPDGSSHNLALTRGATWILPRGTTHIETGVGNSPMRHAVIFDLQDAKPTIVDNGTSLPAGPEVDGSSPTISNPRITVWSVTWSPERTGLMRFYDRNVILVFLDSTTIEETDAGGSRHVAHFASGQVQFLPAGQARAYRALARPARVVIARLER